MLKDILYGFSTAIAFGIILSISRQIEKETLVPARNESMME